MKLIKFDFSCEEGSLIPTYGNNDALNYALEYITWMKHHFCYIYLQIAFSLNVQNLANNLTFRRKFL